MKANEMKIPTAIICLTLLMLCFTCQTQSQDSPSTQTSQPPSNTVDVFTSTSTRIKTRLYNVTQDENGRYLFGGVEFTENGVDWTYPCSRDFDRKAAKVICHHLNFAKAEAVAEGRFGSPTGTSPFPNQIRCTGNENSFDSCNLAYSSASCLPSMSVGVICFNKTEDVYDMRVVDGNETPTRLEGRLEVRLTPITGWGSVCDDSFTDRSATAACKNLGYKLGVAVTGSAWDFLFEDSGVFGSSMETFMDEVFCRPGESFFDCDHENWGGDDCLPSEDVGVACYSTAARLLSAVPEDYHIGTVELYLESQGGWHEVCDPGWDDNDAKVVCKEIGFPDGKALKRNSLGEVSYGSVTAVGSVTNVNCTGDEENLASCSLQEVNLCNFHGAIIDLAAVICYDKPVSQVNMSDATRINGSNPAYPVGFLEIRHLGVWGRVCEDEAIFSQPPISDKEVSVACRMQGFRGGKRIRSLDVVDEKYHIWLRGFSCIGNETSIDQCMTPDWGSPGLSKCVTPVRVACYSKGLQLHFDKQELSSGFLSIVHDEETMNICADSWTDTEAKAACMELGYNSGRVWSSESGGSITTSHVVGDIFCKRSEGSFFTCVKDSWGIEARKCEKGRAGVTCFNEVKIDPGTGATGILQIYNSTLNQWTSICRNEFDDTDASVACKELGYSQGSVLPYAAFGSYVSTHGRFEVRCNGSESSIVNCVYSSDAVGCDSSNNYASISCYNSVSSGTYRLQDGKQDSLEAWGVLQVHNNNTWGYVCEDVFNENDARVFCKEIGRATGNNYNYGVKLSPLQNIPGPYLITYPNCTSNEEFLKECVSGSYLCSKKMAARILCSSNSVAKVELESDLSLFNAGRVMVTINEATGPVCANSWTDVDATVICKQLNPIFKKGVAKFYERTQRRFLFSGVECSGTESSIFQCKNDGWRNPNRSACEDNAKEAGVICYANVILTDGTFEQNSLSGRLSVNTYGDRFRDVCFDYSFTQKEAELVCSELEFSFAALLSPFNSEDELDYYYMLKMFQCKPDDKSLSNCYSRTGFCDGGQVRILCYNDKANNVRGWEIEHGSYGQLTRSIGNKFVGVICPVNFQGEDARLVCEHKTTVNDGEALGSRKFSDSTKEYVWFGPPVCSTSVTTGTTVCSFHQNVSKECFTKNYSAGVLCYEKEMFGIRLMGLRQEGVTTGRVEIMYNNVWGTVCNKNGGRLQARAVCRQLGFLDGTTINSSPNRYGNASGPIYLKNVSCSQEDNQLLACPSAGWGEVSNCTHEDDLEVMCYSKERFYPDPEKSWGAVSVIDQGVYYLVCSNDFTDVEASVFCAAAGYVGGISICCSAFDVPYKEIRMKDVSCTGSEASLLTCQHTMSYNNFACPSGKFASAACSMRPSIERQNVRIEPTGSRRIIIEYYGVKGIVCHDNFTQNDATVACRSQGYPKGLAFDSPDMNEVALAWTSNMQCNGTESRIGLCKNFVLGKTGKCQMASSVVCLREADKLDIEVRLVNGTTLKDGRLQVKIDGTWGSVCNLGERTVGQTEATVLCKKLGYRDGKITPSGTAGPGQGRGWLQGIDCPGPNSKLTDCRLTMLSPDSRRCQTGVYDLTLECFSTARLINGPKGDGSRGILQIQNPATQVWQYVCDKAITDKEATVVCRNMGYQYGKHQCCNAAGEVDGIKNLISSIDCTSATDIAMCDIVRNGSCPGLSYAYVHCSKTEFPSENLEVKSMEDFIGKPVVTRYGIEGRICRTGLSDKEATVMCRELGYAFGLMLPPASKDSNAPIMLKNLSCSGGERSIQDCSYAVLNDGIKCPTQMSAEILCQRSNSPITYRISPAFTEGSGAAEITIDGRVFFMDDYGLTSEVASVFCKSIKGKDYVYGKVVPRRTPSSSLMDASSILMTSVECSGKETSILNCSAVWLPQFTQISLSRKAHFECHTGVELEQGTSPSSGILTLYNSKADDFGVVCNDGFGETEAGVACRMLGYDFGLSHCCMPFGYSYKDTLFKSFKCNGTEKSLLDCEHVAEDENNNRVYCSGSRGYVGITCYNGTKTKGFEISLPGGSDDSTNVGMVRVTYMNTPGTICSDGWDDTDASVACRELGYSGGLAYQHYKPYFSFENDVGPFWLENIECTGQEEHLSDCPHSGLGNVSSCERGHFAGVLCTSGSEVLYRLAGTTQSNYGRVEVRIEGTWGSVCDRFWDYRDASVMCRNLGFATGDVFDIEELDRGTGPVWEINPRCTGEEDDLNQCAHEGWKASVSGSCLTHTRDAGVFCYSSVRLGTGPGKTYSHGPVHYYQDGDWYTVCDDGFNDLSARKVCREIGFYDGLAVCCSAYSGETASREVLHPNITMSCPRSAGVLQECIRQEECNSSSYASVICFENAEKFNETEYTFTMNEDFPGGGRIDVTYLGVEGRICSSKWSDNDAKVYCKSVGYEGGFAYHHSYKESYVTAKTVGPYWISNVHCFGNETNLSECTFNERLELGNCSVAHTAAAVCFNDKGVEYRLGGSNRNSTNVGRIEMSIDNKWGTICERTWDNKDASVACKSLNFTDGEVGVVGEYGRGSGPLWLTDVQCVGNELALHKCPLTGFQNEDVESQSSYPWFVSPCSDHSEDATVFCFKEAKLNQNLGVSSGALLYHKDNKWVHVCDSDSFTNAEAKVACRSLLQGFVDGVPIHGGLHGERKNEFGIRSIQCAGSEPSLSSCNVVAASECSSDKYVSVACFDTPLTSADFNFQLRLSNDSFRTGDDHGILEIRKNGAWGRICMHQFGDKEARVACKQLGFKDGITYLHLFRNRLPILWNNVVCNGNEERLSDCTHDTQEDAEHCSYDSNDAGVLCFNGEGIDYRLTGGQDRSSGRVEIGIDGTYGTVCSSNWNHNDSKVLCKSMGYVDGVPLQERNDSLVYMKTLMSFFLCEGHESNLLNCFNSGFDEGKNIYFCQADAYAACYQEEVAITSTRLGDKAKQEGRVEIYVTGINEWGTVCDDDWDDLDARVVCRSLGFDDGVSTGNSGNNSGSGKILLDNVNCNGSESSLKECASLGINSHNCDHSEDAGVRCFNNPVPVSTPKPITTKKPSTTKKPVSTSSPPTTTTKKPEVTTSTTRTTTRKPEITTKKPTPTPKPKVTTQRPTPATEKTTKSSTTQKPSSSSSLNPAKTEKNSGKEQKNTKVIVAACVTIVLAVVLIAVVVFVVLRHRSRSKAGVRHERFHDDIIEHTNDGSVAVSNRMFENSNPDGVDPMADGSEIHLDRGFVTFSKGSPPPPDGTPSNGNAQEGFSNPLYSAMTNASEVGEDEIHFDDSDTATISTS